MYKEAIKNKMRFQTSKGLLSLEQLWTLTKEELNELAVSLDEAYKASGQKSFLEKKTTKDKGIKAQFDIVIDILNTKVEEEGVAEEIAANKLHNKEIDELIASKEKDGLKELSVAELKKLRKPVS